MLIVHGSRRHQYRGIPAGEYNLPESQKRNTPVQYSSSQAKLVLQLDHDAEARSSRQSADTLFLVCCQKQVVHQRGHCSLCTVVLTV